MESCPSWPKEHDWKSCRRQKRLEGSNPLLSAMKKAVTSYDVTAFLFVEVMRDLKDERYRATVLWTVVTASDQATAVARIKSLALRHKKIRYTFLLCLLVCSSYKDF